METKVDEKVVCGWEDLQDLPVAEPRVTGIDYVKAEVKTVVASIHADVPFNEIIIDDETIERIKERGSAIMDVIDSYALAYGYSPDDVRAASNSVESIREGGRVFPPCTPGRTSLSGRVYKGQPFIRFGDIQ